MNRATKCSFALKFGSKEISLLLTFEIGKMHPKKVSHKIVISFTKVVVFSCCTSISNWIVHPPPSQFIRELWDVLLPCVWHYLPSSSCGHYCVTETGEQPLFHTVHLTNLLIWLQTDTWYSPCVHISLRHCRR